MAETFGPALRRLREQAELSQPELARRVPISQSSLSRYEGDRQRADPTTAARLDDLLDANGALCVLLEPVDAAKTVLTPDDRDRLAYVVDRPRSVDSVALGSLAAVLAESRRMEDRLGAGTILQPTLAYLRLLEQLTMDARGPVRAYVVDLAAQWAQFTGWLHAATDHVTAAAGWFDRTLEWAIEANNVALQANALTFKGNLAWTAGHIEQAERRLDVAAQRAGEIPAHVDDAPPWNYDTSALIALERGLVQHRLGRDGAAADLLTAGMAALPAEQRDAEWADGYRRVLTEVQAKL